MRAAATERSPSGRDAQLETEAVEFEPAHFHVEAQKREKIQPDPAAGRGDDGAALAVVDLDAAESEADAAVAHASGGSAPSETR